MGETPMLQLFGSINFTVAGTLPVDLTFPSFGSIDYNVIVVSSGRRVP
jgi:hypothetical protein